MMAPPRRRVLGVLGVVALVFGLLVYRLVSLQVNPPTKYLDLAAAQRTQSVTLAASRGAIVDRNGADLALSVPQKTIVADPQRMTDVADAATLQTTLRHAAIGRSGPPPHAGWRVSRITVRGTRGRPRRKDNRCRSHWLGQATD